MKSIFSTQNLHTFFFRKYWRLPRGRPPGPPGPPPPGPPSRRGPPCPPDPPSRLGGLLGACACFCSSAMPSTLSLVTPARLGPAIVTQKISVPRSSACRPRLFRRGGRRCPRAARTPRGALLALLH